MNSWWLRIGKQGTLTSTEHLVFPLVYRGRWMSSVSLKVSAIVQCVWSVVFFTSMYSLIMLSCITVICLTMFWVLWRIHQNFVRGIRILILRLLIFALKWKEKLAPQINFTYRYIDDVLPINNPDFENYLDVSRWARDQRHNGELHLCFLFGFTPFNREGRSAAHFPLRQT